MRTKVLISEARVRTKKSVRRAARKRVAADQSAIRVRNRELYALELEERKRVATLAVDLEELYAVENAPIMYTSFSESASGTMIFKPRDEMEMVTTPSGFEYSAKSARRRRQSKRAEKKSLVVGSMGGIEVV